MSDNNNRQAKDDSSPEWIEITEHNDWEGETWHHFFVFSEEHYHTLEETINKHKDDGDFSIRRKSLSWEAAEDLTNRDDGGYMQTYWFGELTRLEEIKQAESLYKGEVRKYGEELFSYQPDAADTAAAASGCGYRGRPVRVFLRPTGLHSRAMVRVADALTRHAPPWIDPSGGPVQPHFADSADLQILHVISYDAVEYAAQILARGGRYAVIQYCLGHPTEILWDAWRKLWAEAELVYSYYPLHEHTQELGVPFYYAPLGVDEVFRSFPLGRSSARPDRILTTGYVTGPRAEPIWEVWQAAELAGIEALHIGPHTIEGMDACPGGYPRGWKSLSGISDRDLAYLYSTSTWVSGLRHVEGFELPAAEGLVCGARPIVFDQPSMREWYGDYAIFIPESHGEELVNHIHWVLTCHHPEASADERQRALTRFNWETTAKGFWEALLR